MSLLEMTVDEDPKWTHECAKEIMKELGIEYDVFKMYDIVSILMKYASNERIHI